ncbi:hypothetical protein ABZ079_24080 [Streptomyces sp. NPDC006314]|uniref:hypothetical protein n=1 Tax=Streptomyces sp. NPDC006314 TaxID=3154475 RepID=UPI0033AAC92F
MTTPSPMTHPPHPYPAPQPAPSRSRRGPVAGLVALLLVVATAAAAFWWTRGGDSGPLAGRPRVTDTRAGLSYGVPEDWKHDPAKDKGLIDAFSSQITSKSHGASTSAGGTVLTGRAGQTVPSAELRRMTESAARSNAEFFFPDQPATLEGSHAAVVDGQPAHTVVLTIPGDDGRARLEMTLVTAHGERTSFLLGLITGASDPALTADLHDVLASTTVS